MMSCNHCVAPHPGAWIEIDEKLEEAQKTEVAPHPGAWIEMIPGVNMDGMPRVAPHPGAWIEMGCPRRAYQTGAGRTPPGCVD